MGDKCKEDMKPESNEFELKDQGNKYFALYKYVDALQCYNKAIMKNPSIATFYTNRSLCYIKMNQWMLAADDAKKALEMEPNLLKGHFFLGLALLELENYEDAIKHIHKAHELAKDQKLNYGDEITYALRLAKKKRFNQLEEKRIKQEIELQSYLLSLIEQDKRRRFKRLEEEAIANHLTDDELSSLQSETNKKCDNYINELNDMFSQLDIRRKKRDIPDYLCGKISFEIMKDPVITPSGITYSKADIIEHLNRVGHFDPLSRHPLTADQLIPNFCMQEVVEGAIQLGIEFMQWRCFCLVDRDDSAFLKSIKKGVTNCQLYMYYGDYTGNVSLSLVICGLLAWLIFVCYFRKILTMTRVANWTPSDWVSLVIVILVTTGIADIFLANIELVIYLKLDYWRMLNLMSFVNYSTFFLKIFCIIRVLRKCRKFSQYYRTHHALYCPTFRDPCLNQNSLLMSHPMSSQLMINPHHLQTNPHLINPMIDQHLQTPIVVSNPYLMNTHLQAPAHIARASNPHINDPHVHAPTQFDLYPKGSYW